MATAMFAMMFLLLASDVGSTDTAPMCSELLARSRSSVLQMEYADFDQTDGKGFRVLAEKGCVREAADLIEEWIVKNGRQHRSVTWHLAQMRAEAGQNAEAVRAAKQVLLAKETEGATFRWNSYVNAFIAFIQKDRVAFDLNAADVAAGSDKHPGNAMNSKLLDRLAGAFEATYADALHDK